jgi:hypothetical protein
VSERGVIRNRAAAQQLRDFSGLRYGRITPTDIDAYMEFGGRLFVFVEAKYGGALLPYGQQLAIERLVDAIHNPPHRYAVAMVVSHDTQGADVSFADTRVQRYRWAGRWRSPQEFGMPLRAALDCVVTKYGTAQVVNAKRAA